MDRFTNEAKVFLQAALLAILVLAGIAGRASAGSYTYANTFRTINAGVLLIDNGSDNDTNVDPTYSTSEGGPYNAVPGADNAEPYVFYILNARNDVKPFGWKFVNPLAPASVTSDIQQRWDSRTANADSVTGVTGDPGTTFLDSMPGYHAYALGQNVTPNMACYWEVSLSELNTTNIQEFDVLFIDAHQNTGGTLSLHFTPQQSELLRKFVDGGGQLWIEDTGGPSTASAGPFGNSGGVIASDVTSDQDTTNQDYAPPFINFQFNSPNGGTNGYAILPSVAGYNFTTNNQISVPIRHPILSTPYMLSQNDIQQLGNVYIRDVYISAGAKPDSSLALPGLGILSTVLGNASYISTNGTNAPMPEIAAGQYGAGEVVIDDLSSSGAINDYVGGLNCGYNNTGNTGPYCGTTLSLASTRDLEFLCNIINWEEAHPNEHKNSHQGNSTSDPLTTSLNSLWQFTLPSASPLAVVAYPTSTSAINAPSPVMNGNFEYVRDATGILRCFDMYPGEQLLGTGSPDDGYPDYVYGTSYDEIWDTGPLSSNVTKTEAPASATFPASPAPAGTSVGGGDPNGSAPTVATLPNGEAVVFIEDSSGKVYVYDATTGMPVSTIVTSNGTISLTTSYLKNSGPTDTSDSFSFTYGSGGIPGPAPSPTYYGGRIYAAQPDNTLYVFDFNTTAATASNGLHVKINATSASEYIDAPPTVTVMSESNSTAGGNANDIMVVLSTNRGIYTIFTGARDETLTGSSSPYTTASTEIPDLNSYPPPIAYTYAATGWPLVQTSTGTNDATFSTGTDQITFSSAATAPETLYADYDVDFTAGSGTQTPLTRQEVGGSGSINTDSLVISAPAVDRAGHVYYTVYDPTSLDSSLCCYQDDGNASNRLLLWRFRLPAATDLVVDADSISYQYLAGFVFEGAPVVDPAYGGYIYALAYNGSEYAVLAFNPTPRIYGSIAIPGQSVPGNVSSLTVTQPLPNTPTFDEFNDPEPYDLAPNQYSYSNTSGNITFKSFAPVPSGAETYPNLNEPYPVQVSYSSSAGAGAGASQATASAVGPVIVPLHTNMLWYSLFSAPAGNQYAPSPMIQLGNFLYFGDSGSGSSGGNIYRVYAYPGNDNMINSSTRNVPYTAVNDAGQEEFTLATSGLIGALTSAPSATTGIVVVNTVPYPNSSPESGGGVQTLGSALYEIADDNRIIEVDASDDASWAVDSTQLTSVTGGQLAYNDPNATNSAYSALATGQRTTTSRDLNHPSAVTRISQDDYLVADTGNNRCVRFDRTGNVTWELTHFNDVAWTNAMRTAYPAYFNKSAPLLQSGESNALSAPNSVQVSTTYVTSTTAPYATQYTIEHYLIADTGNSRILEVDDVYSGLLTANSSNLLPSLLVTPAHNLVWISHTSDVQGRNYRYQSASFLSGSNGATYVVALVTNKAIAPLPPQYAKATAIPLDMLAPPGQDTSGSCIVLLDYDPAQPYGTTSFATGTQADGFISVSGTSGNYQLEVLSSFKAYITYAGEYASGNVGQFDISDAVENIASGAGTAPNVTIQLRNPRYLATYTPPETTGATVGKDLLVADDNGVWDLAIVNGNYVAKWGYTQTDYDYMLASTTSTQTTPNYEPFVATANPLTTSPRAGWSFVPVSVTLAGFDSITDGTTTYSVGRYVVAVSGIQGGTTYAAANYPGTYITTTPTGGAGVVQGSPGGNYPEGISGEVFELKTIQFSPSPLSLGIVCDLTQTISRPTNTGPITQPWFATRVQ